MTKQQARWQRYYTRHQAKEQARTLAYYHAHREAILARMKAERGRRKLEAVKWDG